ncbi:hypothetical protein ACP70R_014456 [Stipagrostis hirtigluma subsp. patula]
MVCPNFCPILLASSTLLQHQQENHPEDYSMPAAVAKNQGCPSESCKAASRDVEVPRVQPKLSEPFLGFTNTAEVWNSRACMMGLIGTFIVELVLHKGILQMIGVEVGKGLDLPL